MKIATVGAGWSGCHIALELAARGHDVVLFDKEPSIFNGVSGSFGIRLHKGPHYPRSPATRADCQLAFDKFCDRYPELLIPMDVSIYGLGREDASGHQSKVEYSDFKRVCFEDTACKEINLDTAPYANLLAAFEVNEHSVMLGPELRRTFNQKLQEARVSVILGDQVEGILRRGNTSTIKTSRQCYKGFDRVINTTGFQSLLPLKPLSHPSFELDVVYQVCLGLEYRDKRPKEKPFSFIVMDGWYPCVMPLVRQPGDHGSYILTHGSYTIIDSFQRLDDAKDRLEGLTSQWVASEVKAPTERDIKKFWPEFLTRFSFVGWKACIQAKLKTDTEFRSSVVFEVDNVIYVFPGKISNVFDASDEVLSLICGCSSVEDDKLRYKADGCLARGLEEIKQPLIDPDRSTCNLRR